MSWRAILESDILTRISGPELEGFRNAALASGQEDPVDDVITQITDQVRGYCAANNAITLGAAGTIPERLLGPALDIIAVEIQLRAAGSIIDPDEERRKKAERAYRLLQDVAAGRFAVEDTDGTESSQVGGHAQRVNHSAPRVSRTNLKGF